MNILYNFIHPGTVLDVKETAMNYIVPVLINLINCRINDMKQIDDEWICGTW